MALRMTMRVGMAVAVIMTMTMAVIVDVVGRQIDDMAVTHATLGDDVVGEVLHVGAAAFEHRDFHAAVVVEMHVQRRLRQIVAFVKIVRQPLGQIARLVIVHIDQRGDASARAGDLKRGLLQPGAG